MFKKFDVDNTDYITGQNLAEAFKRQGLVQISALEIDEMIIKHDINFNGKISFEEFKKIFSSAAANDHSLKQNDLPAEAIEPALN